MALASGIECFIGRPPLLIAGIIIRYFHLDAGCRGKQMIWHANVYFAGNCSLAWRLISAIVLSRLAV